MDDAENTQNIPKPEREMTAEDGLAQLTAQAKELLDKVGEPPTIMADGSSVRLLVPSETLSSSYTFAKLQERTPAADDAPKEYEYSYVLYDRPRDVQILQWGETSTAITHGVKMLGHPDDPLQVVKMIEMNAAALNALKSHLNSLGYAHDNDVIMRKRSAERPAEQPTALRTRILRTLGTISFRKK